MLSIGGSFGEGGGQILRTSLALSLVTGTPFRMEKIRARRKKPGLMRQHLTAVNAATEIGQAAVTGANLGSTEITFTPGSVRPGDYRFVIGTAGSTTLVLQTVLPALLTASGPSTLTLEGGTHNPLAPPFEFLQKCFLPIINRMGPTVVATLDRPGFFPAGGGRLRVSIEPAAELTGLELHERGAIRRITARAAVARLARRIAERELKVLRRELDLDESQVEVIELSTSAGPGNVVTIEIESAQVTEVFTGFGARGVPAEAVAKRAAETARAYLAADVPVGEHLADQLLLPLALAGGGSFKTIPLSLHTRTNAEVLKTFLGTEVSGEPCGAQAWLVEVKTA